MSAYQIIIQDPSGTRAPYIITEFYSLSLTRAFNTIGSLSLVVDSVHFEFGQVWRDWRILVYRTPDNGEMYLEGDTVWLVRSVAYSVDDGTWTFTAEDLLSILNRRIVAYTPETPYADKTFEEFGYVVPPRDLLKADDMIKEYVSENIGPDALEGTRSLASYIFIEEDYGLGPEVEKSAGFQNLLETCRDIAKTSEELGTKLYFDFVNASTGTKFLFKTFVGVRGFNRGKSGSRTVAFTEGVNIESGTLTADFSKEVTYIYAGGVGSGAGRLIFRRYDTARVNASPWNRIEVFEDQKDAEEDERNYVNDELDGKLNKGRPKLLVECSAVDAPGAVYGLDYFYGDIVNVTIQGYSVDCVVDAIDVRVDDNGESLTIRLKGEIDLETERLLATEAEVTSIAGYVEVIGAVNGVHVTTLHGYMEVEVSP